MMYCSVGCSGCGWRRVEMYIGACVNGLEARWHTTVLKRKEAVVANMGTCGVTWMAFVERLLLLEGVLKGIK